MAESQASDKLKTWLLLPAETRAAIIKELEAIAKCPAPQPAELVTETQRLTYARSHARAELVAELKTHGTR